ncbi:hypothetical protein SSX86_027510 [Deinandra increscens subsp. villosa]|uniref:DUF4283 domain-containing protein n=1 Tax=Deinandra increscens subsp. villosa TaxID=3103831 RepID=A0AAP0GKQ5_9ASTR
MKPPSPGHIPLEQPPDGISASNLDPRMSTRASSKTSGSSKTGVIQNGRIHKGRKPLSNINFNEIDKESGHSVSAGRKSPSDHMETSVLEGGDGTHSVNLVPQSPTGRNMLKSPSSPDETTCSVNSIDHNLHTPIRRFTQAGIIEGNINLNPISQNDYVNEQGIPLVDPHLICYDQLSTQLNPHADNDENAHMASRDEPMDATLTTDLQPSNTTQTNATKGETELLNQEAANAWTSYGDGKPSFADKIKRTNMFDEIKIEYLKPIIAETGNRRALFNKSDLKHTAEQCSHLLCGYFIGTSMDFKVVNYQLRNLWRRYDLDEISKSNGGIYLIKFKSEQGLDEVLENGPWMVNNIPILLTKWEPGFCISKPEPSSIPIWVTAHNVPIELWSGRGISKLMSVVGIPLLMDKMTQERCLKPTGKLGYVRVLVEVAADEELPKDIEIEFPPLTIDLLERPRTEEEINAVKEKAEQAQTTTEGTSVNAIVDDGFVTVGKKNRRANNHKTTPEAKLKGPMTDPSPSNNVQQQLPSYSSLRTSSDPIIQQKMKELHECFIESLKAKASTSETPPQKTNPTQQPKPVHKVRNPAPTPKTNPRTNTKAQQSKPTTTKTAAVTSIPKPTSKPIPPSQNQFDALANLDPNAMVEDMGFSPEPSTSVQEQSCSKTKPMQLWKKKAIIDRLTKFRSVKAVDLDSWEPGEWDFFFHQAKILNIDPDFIIEDVAAVDEGTGAFIAEQIQAEFPGRYQMIGAVTQPMV